jgi:hypothetical protein
MALAAETPKRDDVYRSDMPPRERRYNRFTKIRLKSVVDMHSGFLRPHVDII